MKRGCQCRRFQIVMPRNQQLQQSFARMLAAGLKPITWTSIPDPTAERKSARGIERYDL